MTDETDLGGCVLTIATIVCLFAMLLGFATAGEWLWNHVEFTL